MRTIILLFMTMSILTACNTGGTVKTEEDTEFNYTVDRFADVQVLRYHVPGFEDLSLRQKQLLYHLSEAALMGRDIMFDQNCKYNLPIRRMLESIYQTYKGDKTAAEWLALETYLKRIWFSNGIHHHYAEDKFSPGFPPTFLENILRSLPPNLNFLRAGQSVDDFIAEIFPVIFDPSVYAKRTVQTGEDDLVLASANNYYSGVTQLEVETFYNNMRDPSDPTPPSYGLNSRLVKEADGTIREKVWKVGELYTQAIEPIVAELQKAATFAENPAQRAVIETLVEYYQTGNLKTFDAYAILWVQDTASDVDFVNGFTETYGDPLGIKASWESTVNFVNKEATKRTAIISANAQWFEDRSPVDPCFRKKEVKGISAKVITVAMLGGDCYPPTPIGINLPNADWIRRDYGSKSVTIENIAEAYDKASQNNGFAEEFVWSDAERDLIERYGFAVDNLHTDLHECLGHGSGQLLPGVDPNALKSYSSTLEEARADLFGLYYIADPKLFELGAIPSREAWKAEYYRFMMNGLITQLVRVELGKDIEEAHMRNRQLIAKWAYEKTQNDAAPAVEIKQRNNKSYVVINDYNRLRTLFGQLLADVQRIKSEGDYNAGKTLVETYAVKADPAIHAETLERYARLNLSPYRGFINPIMKETRNQAGQVTNITLDYGESYADQMQRYSRNYSFLPSYND